MASLTEAVSDCDTDHWSPQSWRSKAVYAQGVEYHDRSALDKVCRNLQGLPPLVSPARIEEARERFASAARGERFIMQGGDCAESFEDVQLDIINSKTSLLAEQAGLIESKLLLPVTCVGRIAGQYAKPRSSPTETLADGTTVLAFRGHNINGSALDQRRPDPDRLLHGYFYSAVTLNTVSVFASPSNSAKMTPTASSATDFPTGKKSLAKPICHPRAIFTSHEALLLPYESSLTRGRYCTSAAFLWVGERTRQIDGAHIEFLRGVRNPIGVKLSSKVLAGELVALLDRLCSDKTGEPGRITLITRLGATNVKSALPPLIKAVQASGHQPLWMTDPCHGNTVTAKEGSIKTRCAMTILEEAQQTYAIHRSCGSRLGGLHLEQTGESVTECVEHIALGTGDLSLGVNYRTLCDPRLSREQAISLVERFTDYVRNFDLEQELHELVEQKIENCSEQETVNGLAVADVPFVEDHPEELAAFAYQPPLLSEVACSELVAA
ncbi:MAG: hypothetical protein Q9201_006452 [Fulgogasparrea decipioides]